ncbi:hypothetical protein VFPPC_17039 [Pochonia chlamydosporia 170]|uniref:Uncharacterized protein n=1 Tax=Pochonia chlamydosporia 170 TaxID=1380566 RepID=A0A179EY24_METCM|nr:hypothetical protein VFPPC_17039 [Pochonia chlamydosporia 170]OAQ58084.1 hypothetical protein VFPPC_17039 [Pochonia chlamydosporia 170]
MGYSLVWQNMSSFTAVSWFNSVPFRSVSLRGQFGTTYLNHFWLFSIAAAPSSIAQSDCRSKSNSRVAVSAVRIAHQVLTVLACGILFWSIPSFVEM